MKRTNVKLQEWNAQVDVSSWRVCTFLCNSLLASHAAAQLGTEISLLKTCLLLSPTKCVEVLFIQKWEITENIAKQLFSIITFKKTSVCVDFYLRNPNRFPFDPPSYEQKKSWRISSKQLDGNHSYTTRWLQTAVSCSHLIKKSQRKHGNLPEWSKNGSEVSSPRRRSRSSTWQVHVWPTNFFQVEIEEWSNKLSTYS